MGSQGEMRLMKILAKALVPALASLVWSMPAIAADQSGQMDAGAYKVEITPQIDFKAAGLTLRDPLYVRAIVVQQDKVCAVLVGVDQGGVATATINSAIARSSKATGCAAENYVISATHTHSGGTGMMGLGGEPSAAVVENAIVDAVTNAHKNRRKARIGYGTIQVDLNVNRDLFLNGRWMQGTNEKGVSDNTLSVLQFIDDQDMPIGIYMNYAMHPVNFFLSGVISADFAGDASRHVERQYGPSTVAVFSQGASGDQNPRLMGPMYRILGLRTQTPGLTDMRVTADPAWVVNAKERDPLARLGKASVNGISEEAAEQYRQAYARSNDIVAGMGALLGESAIEAMRLHTTGWSSKGKIWSGAREVQCPGRDRQDRDNLVREGSLPPYADGDPVKIRVGMLRLGDVYLATVNGEVYNEIAVRLKQEAPVSRLAMVTLANGFANSGYIYSNDAGSHLTFQVIGSRLKPNCAEDGIVSAALGLIEDAKN